MNVNELAKLFDNHKPVLGTSEDGEKMPMSCCGEWALGWSGYAFHVLEKEGLT